MNSLSQVLKKSSGTATSEQFVEYLLTQRIEEYPYLRLPKYTFKELKKGIPCQNCNGFLTNFSRTKLICHNCESIEKLDESVLRSVEEFLTLFPDERITTDKLYEWCSVVSKRSIRSILLNSYQRIGEGRGVHYIKQY